ncbi:MAG: serine hydrolase [Bacteroidia bacterium]
MNVKNSELSCKDIIWNTKIKLPYVLLIVLLSLVFLAAGQYTLFKSQNPTPPAVVVQSDDCPPPPTVRYRMNEYQFTHPLLLVDRFIESKDMMSLKNEVALMLEQKKQAGIIDAGSVYLRDMTSTDWMCVQPEEEFNPGSLIKVPIMMTYLREAEINPGLLNKKLSLDARRQVPRQTYEGDRILPGKSYSIRELLYYMVVKSDNYATLLLNENVNIPVFKKLFVDLGLPEPDVHDPDFHITSVNYSKFMRVLYNASYVNNENAEYALSLLVQSDFNEGIVKQLPPDIKVARKFGEWGNSKDSNNHQLHESGIVYINKNPYLITIMTKGRHVLPLPQAVSDISKLVYDRMSVKQPKS